MSSKQTRLCARDRRQQILAVAMNLFAGQGYGSTTTRQIAERAGVTEAIIFRHFPTKEHLYWAILEDKCTRDSGRRQMEERLGADAPHEELFAAIAYDVLRRNADDPSRWRLMLFSGLENHELSRRFFRTYMTSYYRTLAGKVRQLTRDGVFRRVDPLIAARSFLGMLAHYFLVQELFAGKDYSESSLRKVSRAMSEIWVRGMLAEAEVGQPSRPAPAKANGKTADADVCPTRTATAAAASGFNGQAAEVLVPRNSSRVRSAGHK